MATTVIHKRNEQPGDIYIGRPSKWGNPFSHKPGTQAHHRVATREDAVKAYEQWLLLNPELLAQVRELRGHRLVCWCKPLACHGDVLAKYADKETT